MRETKRAILKTFSYFFHLFETMKFLNNLNSFPWFKCFQTFHTLQQTLTLFTFVQLTHLCTNFVLVAEYSWCVHQCIIMKYNPICQILINILWSSCDYNVKSEIFSEPEYYCVISNLVFTRIVFYLLLTSNIIFW